MLINLTLNSRLTNATLSDLIFQWSDLTLIFFDHIVIYDIVTLHVLTADFASLCLVLSCLVLTWRDYARIHSVRCSNQF